MITNELRESWRFMHEHAGYIVGRRAESALQLARAELRARELDLDFQWDYDQCPDISWMDEKQTQEYNDGRLLVLDCIVERGEHFASLGGISVYSWDDSYRRVVEAELASEILHEIDAEQAEEAGLHRDPVR